MTAKTKRQRAAQQAHRNKLTPRQKLENLQRRALKDLTDGILPKKLLHTILEHAFILGELQGLSVLD